MYGYEVFYVDKSNRIEAMLVCSLKKNINWYEDGLKLVSWKYYKTHTGQAESLNKIFVLYSSLKIDKRRKQKAVRTINIGDVILFDGNPWIISSFGFVRIPQILWEKTNIQE